MNVVDIVIICLIAAAFVYAVRKMFKKSASGSCANCDTGCSCSPDDNSHCCGAAEDMVARMEEAAQNIHASRDK